MSCLVCQSNDFISLYDNTLRRCSRCGFVTANMDIGEEALRAIYNDGYFDGAEVFDYVNTQHSRQINFSHHLEHVLRIVGEDVLRTVLEIGCAYGFFGGVVKQRLPSADYTGVDIASDAIDYGRKQLGLNTVLADYLATPFAPNRFTSVFMWDVIEHLPRPDLFLQKAKGELAPGGVLVIATPDIAALVPRIRGRHWRNIHPPTHLHYFSPKTMTQFLDCIGFDVVTVMHHGIYRNVRLLFSHLFCKRQEPTGWKKLIYRMIPVDLTIPVNTFDNMVVVARRRL